MRKVILGGLLYCALTATFTIDAVAANSALVSPDRRISVALFIDAHDQAQYQISQDRQPVLLASRLGLALSDRQFLNNIRSIKPSDITQINEHYQLYSGKQSQVDYSANQQQFVLTNDKMQQLEITFRVSNDGVAFRYRALEDKRIDKQSPKPVSVVEEYTRFNLPQQSRAWLQPIAEAQTGWEHTNPSYEEHYQTDIPVEQPSPSPAGWVFPALFKISNKTDNTWMAITEAGVTANDHASRLQARSPKGEYAIGLPMAAEVFTGKALLSHGTLPLQTPWRVIAIGSLATIADSTLGTDLAEPSAMDTRFIKPGIASWSWGLLKDDATVYSVQQQFIDHAADMHWQYTLIDADWDQKIGDDKLKQLVDYAAGKNVGIWVWYNSSGDWNTTKYSPKSRLLTAETRQQEFAKLHNLGVKGVKIDFFAGDGQSMMAYYHDILNNAAKYELLVNFHGTTLPRGLSRTYPNLLSAEAVKGFEMITFFQEAADKEASHSAMLPFTRNLFDPMDFTPTTFNDIPNIKRKTTNAFELALPILFVSGIQHIVETPAGMKTVPTFVKSVMQQLPTHWDESRFIAGYPGKLAVFARRAGDTWFVAGINGEAEAKTITLDLSFLQTMGGNIEMIVSDGERGFQTHKVVLSAKTEIKLQGNDGFIIRITPKS